MGDSSFEAERTFPEVSDRLFKPDDDAWNNACLNFASSPWDVYARGFKRAGDILVKHVLSDGSDIDTLVYPVVFVFRQYIELRLKDIIADGRSLLDDQKAMTLGHGLIKLWGQARGIIVRIFENEDTSDLANLEMLLQEFEEVDPGSMAFRYPVDKNGNPSTPGLSHINIRNLSDVMFKIETLLEGIFSMISSYLDHKREMESYCGE